ncbi:MAG: hypothetical protein CEE41_00025 [Hadesarchaea archaeon B3_Hades]|nr:MAG: hypothetical protein CEE41_00025 [Hadesarchaea archaeon B3_Hades]
MKMIVNTAEKFSNTGLVTERRHIEQKFCPLMREELELGRLVSYVGNKFVPFLRLYRFKEAFAFDLVRIFIKKFDLSPKDYVFDPFMGMGTTLFASMLEGIPSIGIDRLPIAVFVAKTIPHFLSIQKGELKSTFEILSQKVNSEKVNFNDARFALDVPLMKLAFTKKQILELRRWKAAIDTLSDPQVRDIFMLLFFSILEESSYTSKDGQFLRLKKDKTLAKPGEALVRKLVQAEEDINRVQDLCKKNPKELPLPQVFSSDTRDLSNIHFERPPTAIITSPPYPNRYDYTRSYCLELCSHFVKNFEELRALRFSMLRSHIESKVSKEEKSPHPVIQEVVEALNAKELNNPRIPYMLIGYFNDMQRAIEQWSSILAQEAQVAVVVDNVRFEGELVPVDLVFSEIAENVGFEVKEIIISRYKGNSSQQMKKYGRVPVRESVVVWEKL